MPHNHDEINAQHFTKIKELAPDQELAFQEFNEAVFQEGTLSKKEKEIIAVAIAHVTKCTHCMATHTKKAKSEGASLKELAEAGFVAAGIEAGGAVTHSTHIPNAQNPESDDVLYVRSNLKKLNFIGKHAHTGFRSYSNFSAASTKEGELSTKFKETIAVAVAHATQCPYCIDVHTKNALKAGATDQELSEAAVITSALLAGGAYVQILNMIESYGE